MWYFVTYDAKSSRYLERCGWVLFCCDEILLYEKIPTKMEGKRSLIIEKKGAMSYNTIAIVVSIYENGSNSRKQE